jgi:hypothetical protein
MVVWFDGQANFTTVPAALKMTLALKVFKRDLKLERRNFLEKFSEFRAIISSFFLSKQVYRAAGKI